MVGRMRTARAAVRGVSRRDDGADVSGRREPAVLLALDVLAVVLFAAAGRRSHAEGLSAAGVLATAWPFLAGTVAGWGVARAWRRPTSPTTGLVVWVAAVVLGMLLRRLTGDGTAWPFVVVATVVLAALVIGWRAAVRVVRSREPRG
jgi:peptidoglycan/LPS O-acetylase OafA/YrhL